MFLEGPRLILEALNARCKPEMLIVSEDFPQISFLEPILAQTKRVIKVSESVFKAISDMQSPQGLLAIARQPKWTWEQIFLRKPAPVVILDGLQDPGNAASIIRTAEAAGAAGIVTTPGTAHLYAPKSLRGAMGSSLRVPVMEHLDHETIAVCLKQAGYSLAATPLKFDKDVTRFDKLDWKQPWAIIMGQEAKGVSSVWDKHIQARVLIPMQPPLESLNVAAAAAVLLYESYMQRVKEVLP